MMISQLVMMSQLVLISQLVENKDDKDKAPPKPVGRLVHYSGRVQGVGFRAASARIARDFPVTGWVKNLSDGRVQLLVEGPADAVDNFLKAVRKHWKDNIEQEKIEEQPVSGKYKKFEVVY